MPTPTLILHPLDTRQTASFSNQHDAMHPERLHVCVHRLRKHRTQDRGQRDTKQSATGHLGKRYKARSAGPLTCLGEPRALQEAAGWMREQGQHLRQRACGAEAEGAGVGIATEAGVTLGGGGAAASRLCHTLPSPAGVVLGVRSHNEAEMGPGCS